MEYYIPWWMLWAWFSPKGPLCRWTKHLLMPQLFRPWPLLTAVQQSIKYLNTRVLGTFLGA